MNDLIINSALHIAEDQMLARSRWFGPNLLTFLATAEDTGGVYTLIKCILRKGFEPPLHIHSREEESYIIMEGQVNYEVGDKCIHAKAGDFVHLPRSVPHTFKLVSDTATILLIITPSGFEEMFIQFSRPALAMELPPLPTEKPGPEFFQKMAKVNAELGVTMLPNL